VLPDQTNSLMKFAHHADNSRLCKSTNN